MAQRVKVDLAKNAAEDAGERAIPQAGEKAYSVSAMLKQPAQMRGFSMIELLPIRLHVAACTLCLGILRRQLPVGSAAGGAAAAGGVDIILRICRAGIMHAM